MHYRIFLLLFLLFENSLCTEKNKYCEISPAHVLCNYPPVGGNCLNNFVEFIPTREQEKEILDWHNSKRQDVSFGIHSGGNYHYPAANMMKMQWDPELARIAQITANQCDTNINCSECRGVLGGRFMVGQNYGYDSENTEIALNFTKIMQNWFTQNKNMPSKNVNSYIHGEQYEEYSQLVWWNTRSVGCGGAMYTANAFFKFKYFFFCAYGPAGNIYNKKMYISGNAAEKCPNGTKKDEQYWGLCAITKKNFNVADEFPTDKIQEESDDGPVDDIHTRRIFLRRNNECPKGSKSYSVNPRFCVLTQLHFKVVDEFQKVPKQSSPEEIKHKATNDPAISFREVTLYTRKETDVQCPRGTQKNDHNNFFCTITQRKYIAKYEIRQIKEYVTVSEPEYCNTTKSHIMCSHPSVGKDCFDQFEEIIPMWEQQDEILHWHNSRRQEVAFGLKGESPQYPAANMIKMQWDPELAKIAQRTASQCQLAFNCSECRRVLGDRFSVGQNVATVAETYPIEFNFTELMQTWFDEVKTMPRNKVPLFVSNESYREYSQLVWWNTRSVGCGGAKFRQRRSRKSYKNTLYCMYGPTGNIHNKRMYLRGEAASRCYAETKIDDKYPGLCAITRKNFEFDDEFPTDIIQLDPPVRSKIQG